MSVPELERAAPNARLKGPERGLEFAFDARKKSIVPAVMAQEKKRLRRLFARKPKVSLHDVEAALAQGVSGQELQRLMEGFHRFYYTHDSAHQYYETLGRLLVEAAAKRKDDPALQRVLLQQALEALSIAIQKSPKAINIAAQSIVVSVSRLLGPAYATTFACEREVHREMVNMLNVRRDPNDFGTRERIIRRYLQGRRYYEALVQLAEYERIMRTTSRPLYQQKQGELAFRKAGILQAIIDHYYRIRTGADGERSNLADLLELQAFTRRFNRDNRRVRLTPMKATSVLALEKTLVSLVAIANSFYLEASKARGFRATYRPLFLMARNNYRFDNRKAALQNLAEGLRLLEHAQVGAQTRTQEKLKLLEFQYRIYQEMGHRAKAEDIYREMSHLRRERQGAEEGEASA